MTPTSADLYSLLDPPPIPGLRFRPFAGVSDAGSLAAIHAGRAVHDAVDPHSTTESIWTQDDFAKSLDAMVEAGESDRTILAEIEGRAVGYNRFFNWEEADGMQVWLIVGWVLPEWRGRGLGTAMLRWGEGRIRALAGPPSARWEFAGNATSTEPDAMALLHDNGYLVAYHVLEMALDWDAFTPTLDVPPAIEIRPGSPHDAPLIAASVEESYAGEFEGGRYSEKFDPAAYAEELAGSGHDPGLWRVAWDGTSVAGQVIPRIERGRAEIYEVSVRPGWRRAGIARAMLTAACLNLRERQIEHVRLHTVAEFRTRAVDLYESLGFRTLKTFSRYRKPPSSIPVKG